MISFTTATALANGLYQLTLVGTGSNAIRDIAGNTPANGDVVVDLRRLQSQQRHGVFVGPASFVTDPTQPAGDRANPFPTITAALAAATVGDRLEILPGVYTENVTLLPFVSLVSADTSSTDTTFVPGNALTRSSAPRPGLGDNEHHRHGDQSQLLRQPLHRAVFQTEIGGLTIASPLVGDPALGAINPSSIGLANNSDILIDRNYFIDAGTGILVTTSGANSRPRRSSTTGSSATSTASW